MSHSGLYVHRKANVASFLTNNSDLRNDFANRVFGIATLQFGGVCAINILCRASDSWAELAIALRSIWAIIAMSLLVVLTCYRKAARRRPSNYYLMAALIVSVGFTVFSLTANDHPAHMMKLLLHLTLSVGLLAMVSTLTEVRFTSNSFVFYFFWAHLVLSLFAKWMIGGHVFFYYLLGLVTALYMIFDLQSLINRKDLELRFDEPIYATFKSYTDVFTLLGVLTDWFFDREPIAEE